MFQSILSYAKIPALAVALLLTAAEQSEAQFRGGYGRGGGGYGGGYGRGGGFNIGIGGRGVGVFVGRPGYYGYNQGYYGQAYYPANYYSYQPYVVSPTYTTLQPIPDTTGYQSNYPSTAQIGGTENTAMIEVLVPPDVELWFDGTKTQQTGGTRYFVTPPLTPGKTYTYEVRITSPTAIQSASTTRQVEVQAGKRTTLNFLEPLGSPK